ncbi:MAG: hypothetical protein GY789_05625 [Hyphomicrobiales bacterium]|nr:hypothetical protein [Hyphomicrobiales bacterium]MCP5001944.1 hypothetical protein [Hyphomicrobiales bacterium]
MTDNRDPALQALFAASEVELPGEAFTAGVMEKTNGMKRRAIFIRLFAGLALVACAWFLSMPVQHVVNLLAQALTTPLIHLHDQLLAQILLPLNTAAFPVALAVLALRRIHRRLFS